MSTIGDVDTYACRASAEAERDLLPPGVYELKGSMRVGDSENRAWMVASVPIRIVEAPTD